MLLAAGQGTRLRAVTGDIPKPMVVVNGRPILDWTLDALAHYGVRDVVINTHHRGDVISGFCGDGSRWGLRIQYSPERRLQGTAGALRPWRRFFDRTFFVVYGDNMSTCRYDRLLEAHQTRRANATVALFWRPDPTSSGIAALDDEGWIARFVEKPSPDQVFSRWVNAGVLVVEPHLLEAIPDSGPVDFSRDLLPQWTAERRVLGYRMSDDEKLWWIDTPQDLARVEAEFRHDGARA
jgi:NDP-sugar pyrophosphorylase family protein